MLLSVLLYVGIATTALGGLASIFRKSRRAGAAAVVVGIAEVVVALAWPVSERRVTTAVTRLDQFMPRWQFDERHSVHVDAPPDRTYAAIRAVRAKDIKLFLLLTKIRRGGRPGPESILNAPEEKPLLDVATQSGFIYLANDAPREVVVGTAVIVPRPRSGRPLTPEVFHRQLPPGFALAAMNFLVAPDGKGSLVTTDTRVYANSARAANRFKIYWRFIHPGSDIIRRMWLRAVKQRAERAR
jgi:hypothetical protein